jgi:hypothetical protein
LFLANVVTTCHAAIDNARTFTLAPPFAEVMTKAHQPLLQAIFDLETPAMIIGRVALLGDAAFVARPHVRHGHD